MTKLFTFLYLLLSCTFAWSQSGADKAQTVTINKQSFGTYPAVLFDLKNNKVIKLANDFKEEDFAGDADLWIEPRDPEINCLERVEDSKLKGVTPHIVTTETAFDQLNEQNMPKQIDKNEVPRAQIKEGTVFLVQASSNAVYKVRIDRTDKATETLTLTYQLIRK